MATRQGNMEPGTRPYAKRVVALPTEGALSPIIAFVRGEARWAWPIEGALSP